MVLHAVITGIFFLFFILNTKIVVTDSAQAGPGIIPQADLRKTGEVSESSARRKLNHIHFTPL